MAIQLSSYVAQAQASPASGGRLQQAPLESFDQGARSLMVAGTSLMQAGADVAAVAQQQYKADQASFVLQRVTAAEEKMRTKQNEFLGLQGINADGVDRQAVDFADAITREATDGADELSRIAIIDQLSSKRSSMLNSVAAHARRENLSVKQQTLTSRVQGLSSDFITTTNPQEEQATLRNLALTVESMGAALGQDAETINYNIAAHTSKAVSGKVLNMVESDPRRALAYYQQAKDTIMPEDRAGLEHRINGRIEHDEAKRKAAVAERRAELAGGVNDAYAYMMATGDASALQQIKIGLRAIGDTDRASKIEQTIKAGSMAYEMTSKGESLPFAERVNEVNRSFQVTGVEGAADVIEARNLALRKVSQDMESFRKDPAGYVDAGIPQSSQGSARLQARLDRQRELGAGLEFKPEVLTDVEKSTLHRQWNDAKDGRAKLDMVAAINAQYGTFAPAIMDELKIPTGAVAGASLLGITAAADTDAALLVTAATTKRSDIPKAEVMKPADVTAAVEKSGVYAVKAKVARIIGADAMTQESTRSLQNTLYNTVLITGDTDKANVLDAYYGTVDDDEHALTYDKKLIPNDNTLLDALEARKKEFAPQYGTSAPKGIMSRFLGNAYENSTVWIDAPDGNGWVLLNTVTQALVADTASGGPLRVTMDDVTKQRKKTVGISVGSMR